MPAETKPLIPCPTDIMSAFARKLLGLSDDWKGYKFDVVETKKFNGWRVTGAVPSGVYTTGEWKGYPIWTADDKKRTKAVVKFTDADFRAFETEFKAEWMKTHGYVS